MSLSRWRSLTAIVVVFAAIIGCESKAPPTATKTLSVEKASPQSEVPPKTTHELTIAAASDLKFVLDEIITEFEKQHPDTHLVATYGSSGSFFAQLTQRAPFDLFLSADISYPQRLIEQKLADPETLFPYATGQIVVWVPKNSTLDVENRGIDVLTDATVQKIAIANPKVAPYGRAAEAALKKHELYETVSNRLVIGENIAQTAQFVESGAADVGIISLSLASSAALKEKGRYSVVPRADYPPIEQAGVITSWTKEMETAHQFRTFLLGDVSRSILEAHGFLLPAKSTEP